MPEVHFVTGEGPFKGVCEAAVVLMEAVANGSDQFMAGIPDSVLEISPREGRKRQFRHVQPGSVRRSEMKADSTSELPQPRLSRFRLMRRGSIQDVMNPFRIGMTVDVFFQSPLKVSTVGARRSLSPQCAADKIVNQKKVGRSMADVFVVTTQGATGLSGQIRVGTGERLNLGFLIEAEDRFSLLQKALGPFVVPEDAGRLFFEVGGGGVFPVEGAVRLQVHGLKDEVKRRVMNRGDDSLPNDLGLKRPISPSLLPKTRGPWKAASQGDHLGDLQRGKNGCGCPLWVRPEARSGRASCNAGKLSRRWCGHGPSVRRQRKDSALERTTEECARGRRPDAPFSRSASVFEGFPHVPRQE